MLDAHFRAVAARTAGGRRAPERPSSDGDCCEGAEKEGAERGGNDREGAPTVVAAGGRAGAEPLALEALPVLAGHVAPGAAHHPAVVAGVHHRAPAAVAAVAVHHAGPHGGAAVVG